jgi:hypothetical protein
MPAMPRPDTRATRIAYKILGKPENQKFRRTKKQQWVNKRLIWEETQRVR